MTCGHSSSCKQGYKLVGSADLAVIGRCNYRFVNDRRAICKDKLSKCVSSGKGNVGLNPPMNK